MLADRREKFWMLGVLVLMGLAAWLCLKSNNVSNNSPVSVLTGDESRQKIAAPVCGHESLIGELRGKIADLERQLAEEKALTRKFLLESLEAKKERDEALAALKAVRNAEGERTEKTKDRFRDLLDGLNAIKDPAEREVARFRLKRDLEEQFWPLLVAYGDPLKALDVFGLVTSIRDSGEVGGITVESLAKAEGVTAQPETQSPLVADIRRVGGVRQYWEKRMDEIFEGRGAKAISDMRNLYPLPEGIKSPSEMIPLEDPRSIARRDWQLRNPFPPCFWED